MKKALLFLNGGPATGISDSYDTVVACNGGSALAKKHGIRPHVVIGDHDSLVPGLGKWLESAVFIPYPQEKSMTDGELGIKYLIDGHFDRIDIAGAFGGRIDQALTNTMICTRFLDRAIFRLLLDAGTAWFVGGAAMNLELPLPAGSSISLVPLEMSGVELFEGVKYPLHGRRIEPGCSLTVSNEVVSDPVRIELSYGRMLLVSYPADHGCKGGK